MTRVMAFLVVFLTGTACHLDVKKSSTTDDVKTSQAVIESVTTAPTERVTEKWHFSITPGVGRALPGGGPALPPDAPPRASAGFAPSPGLGYALDEYERITEKLEAVATTKATVNTNETAKTTTTLERETDVGPGWKLYFGIGLALALVVGVAYVHLKFNLPTVAKAILKRVLG